MESGLVLGSRRQHHGWLSLRDVFGDLQLSGVRLAFLSACQSGSIAPSRADDYVGLSSGFLYAGPMP